MAAHVLRCAACRHEYDELAATVEDLLPAVPGVQPPLGFDERVLARLGATRPPAPTHGSRRRWRRGSPWRPPRLLVALLVPFGIWWRRAMTATPRPVTSPRCSLLPRRHGRRHGLGQRRRRRRR